MVEENEETNALKVVAKNGVFPILKSLEERPKKFSDLMFNTQLNPGVVDRHLKVLKDYRLVQRENNLYSLTEKGRKLLPALKKVVEIINS